MFLSTYFHRNVHENTRFFVRFLLKIWSQIPDLWTKIVVFCKNHAIIEMGVPGKELRQKWPLFGRAKVQQKHHNIQPFVSPKQPSFWQHVYKMLWCLTHRYQCKNMFSPKINKIFVTKQTDFLLQNVNIFWPTFVLKSWKIDIQTNFFQWILFEEMMI